MLKYHNGSWLASGSRISAHPFSVSKTDFCPVRRSITTHTLTRKTLPAYNNALGRSPVRATTHIPVKHSLPTRPHWAGHWSGPKHTHTHKILPAYKTALGRLPVRGHTTRIHVKHSLPTRSHNTCTSKTGPP